MDSLVAELAEAAPISPSTQAQEEQQTQEAQPGQSSGTPAPPPVAEVPPVPKTYTEEEFRAEVDKTKRELETHAQRIYQENAEIRRHLEQQRATAEDPKEKYFQEYLKNPDKVNREIYDAIDQLEGITPDNENYVVARKQIVQLLKAKDEFSSKALAMKEQSQNATTLYAQVVGEVTRAIPDFQAKMPELKKYAIETLGYTEDTLSDVTAPMRGKAAVQTILAINRAYEKSKAADPSKAIINRIPPKEPNPPGGSSGGEEGKKLTMAEAAKLPFSEFQKWKKDNGY